MQESHKHAYRLYRSGSASHFDSFHVNRLLLHYNTVKHHAKKGQVGPNEITQFNSLCRVFLVHSLSLYSKRDESDVKQSSIIFFMTFSALV